MPTNIALVPAICRSGTARCDNDDVPFGFDGMTLTVNVS